MMPREEIIKQLKPYFNVKELVCNHIYSRFGEQSWMFLSTQLLHVLLCLRTDILRMPMHINTSTMHQRGMRCNLCPLVKSKKGVYVSGHCFDKDTEVLTNNGWKKYYNILNSDMLFTYNIQNDSIEQKPIDGIIRYDFDGELLCAENQHISYAVTDKHRMIVQNQTGKYKRVTNKVISEKWQNYLNSLKKNNGYHIELADSIHGSRKLFKTAGLSSCNNEYDINLLRFCMAVISDGYLEIKGNCVAYRFNLKKERDKKELEDILSALHWNYTKNYSKSHEKNGCQGVYSYYINSTTGCQVKQIIGLDKKIPLWFLSLKPDILKQLIITYAKFDGTFDNRDNNSGITIYSTDDYNTDILQIMSILCGMRCVKKHEKNVQVNIRGCSYNVKDFYKLFITQTKDCSDVQRDCYYTKKYKGVVWCVNNENTTLITRRNGKVVFMGNCTGNAIDFTCDDKTAEEIREMIKAKPLLLPCKIRLEDGVSWVHIDVYDDGTEDKITTFKA